MPEAREHGKFYDVKLDGTPNPVNARQEGGGPFYSEHVERTKNLQARNINLEKLTTFVFLPPGKGRLNFFA